MNLGLLVCDHAHALPTWPCLADLSSLLHLFARCKRVAGATSQSFALASGSQALANAVSVCAIIISTGDSINNNSAMAGGAMYSSDMTTTWINCSSSAKSSSQHSGCPA